MYEDWLPRARLLLISFIETWLMVFEMIVSGTTTKAELWGIPPKLVSDLKQSWEKAKEVLAIVMSNERTPISVVACEQAFTDLATEARYIKKHYLLSPPLTAEDLKSLLLNVPGTSSPIPPPDGKPLVTVSYPGGPHTLKLHLGPLPGTNPLNPRSGYGYAVYSGLMPLGGATLEQAASAKHYLMTVPEDGEGLIHLLFTNRKTEIIEYPASEARMTAFFCARYEKKNNPPCGWGTVTQVTVP